MEVEVDYIIGEDDKGKFVKFEKNGAQATIRFQMNDASEMMAGAKQILLAVYERTAKTKNNRMKEEKIEDRILLVSCINEGAG